MVETGLERVRGCGGWMVFGGCYRGDGDGDGGHVGYGWGGENEDVGVNMTVKNFSGD